MKKLAVGLTALVLSVPAMANEGGGNAIEEIFGAVDFGSVVGFIGTAGVTIVGIALALKGIGLAKRAISRA